MYDPSHFNDRLLLGLKGTMSEAELHVLRMRLQGGIESKARRGELKTRLPTGLVYDDHDRVVFDPDRQVQQALATFFNVFRRQGTACAIVRHFHKEGLSFPRRIHAGAQGRLDLGSVELPAGPENPAQSALRRGFHPWPNAGPQDARRQGQRRTVPQDQWSIVLPNCHVGYITWEEFQQNQRRLRENSAAHGEDRRRSPPREGPALLQGLVVCGRCGKPMTVCYRNHKNGPEPTYVCRHKNVERAEAACQYIAGAKIDEAVAALLLEMVTPLSLQVALEVQDALQTQLDEAERLRRQQVQRARYEADLAKQRFMRVDPNNRLVADALEAEWNEKLRMLNNAQETCDRQRQADRAVLNDKQRQEVLSLAEDFPCLWRDPRVSHRERKRMVRLLIEDVTLLRGEQVSIGICFRGGATRSLTIPVPLPAYRVWQTSPEIVAQIDRLLDHHTEGEIATRLNAQGLRSGKGGCFRGTIIAHIRRRYHLTSRYDRLRKIGMLNVKEIAKRCAFPQSRPIGGESLGFSRPTPIMTRTDTFSSRLPTRSLSHGVARNSPIPSDLARFAPRMRKRCSMQPNPSLGGTTGARMFRSRRRCVGQRRAWGWSPGLPCREFFVETTGSPKFLGNPNSRLHMFSDPGRPMRP